jgi:branched-chain amino acid transport system permease protein
MNQEGMMSNPMKITLGVVAVLLIVFPLFSNPYTVQVAITTITYSMLGLAFAFSMRVGLPRMDVAAWWGVGGYTTAILMKEGVSFWPTVLIGGLIAVIVGAVVFSIAIPRGMMAFFIFCMVLSLAFYQMYGTVKFFGGWSGIVNVPVPTIGSFEFIGKKAIYYLGLFFLVVNAFVYYLIYNSKIGRAFNAIGSSLRLARSLGIDVVKYRMANVLIGNFFIAVAGSFFVAYYRAAFPAIFSFNAGLNVMVYLIVGGFAYSLSGPIFGALIATFVPEYLRVESQYQVIFTSAIVIIILMFLPSGVIGWVDQKLRPWLISQKWFARANKSA